MGDLRARLLRRRSAAELVAETGVDSGTGELSRTIGVFQLSMIGVGATIGTGIFFVLSEAVPKAGPAVVWSFVLAAVVAGLTAVCYAELASAVPVSGSAYTYAYTTLGELAAMVVAACLLLEYGVSASAVVVGWSQYLNQLLDNVFGVRIPQALAAAPEAGGWVNLPAVVLVALCALLLVRGTAESVRTNAAMVLVKLAVLVLFVVVGVRGWDADHLVHFAPYGVAGVYGAAGVIFFSFVGLDNVATAGEEVKNPRRTMPVAIMIALGVVTLVYVAVALVAVAAQDRARFEGQEAGLAAILQDIVGSTWPGTVLAAGAIISIVSVTLTALYSQTRILFAMSRDGLLPAVFHRVNPRTVTPVRNTVIVATGVAVLAGLLPIEFLAEMTSIGTLVAFIVVSVGVIVLRRTAPDLPRGFRVPGYPVTPVLSVVGCVVLITSLRPVTILACALWTAAALVWYLLWGIRHSRLAREAR
ncbi:amino acid permease [Pseudonocardia acaciae]|uniref:amino acid permease n=1 Tax=Pseudonocardia acaciae TaxID=551276 RepID=UPI00048C0298|nr:amino acid permease [Pseudonocardia acaciae]